MLGFRIIVSLYKLYTEMFGNLKYISYFYERFLFWFNPEEYDELKQKGLRLDFF